MKLKKAKEDFIIASATKLFLDKSINEITIKDIANDVGISEATLYRMFNKKENIVIKVAIKLQTNLFQEYFDLDNDKKGIDLIKQIYDVFLKIFEKNVEYYKFINEFDNYILDKDIEVDEYEENMKLFYDRFLFAYEKGLNDGSIKKIQDTYLFYTTTAHALLSLCKKLASGAILKIDEKINNLEEIKLLIDLIMFNLRN